MIDVRIPIRNFLVGEGVFDASPSMEKSQVMVYRLPVVHTE